MFFKNTPSNEAKVHRDLAETVISLFPEGTRHRMVDGTSC